VLAPAPKAANRNQSNRELVWLAVMFVVSRLSEPARFGFDGLRERLSRFALAGAWMVALLAMTGSLYFSEVAHYTPCLLCWYQRIAMYPLVLVLGIAAWRRDLGIRLYAIPLAAVGSVISAYHYLLEWFPALDTGACVVGVPCTAGPRRVTVTPGSTAPDSSVTTPRMSPVVRCAHPVSGAVSRAAIANIQTRRDRM